MKAFSILKLSQEEIEQFFTQLESYDYTRFTKHLADPTFIDDFDLYNKSRYNLFLTHHNNTSILSDKDKKDAFLE